MLLEKTQEMPNHIIVIFDHSGSMAEGFSGRPSASGVRGEYASHLTKIEEAKIRDQRNQKIRAAHVEHGHSLTSIGRHLDLHYSTISKMVQREEEQKKSSAKI